MTDQKEEIVKVITSSGMIATLAALARALVVKKEKILERLRILFASVCIGVLAGIIVNTVDMSTFKKTLIISTCSAFGSSLWPEVEKLILKFLKKGDKINDVLHNNDN